MPYKDKEKQKEAQRQHYLNNKQKYRDGIQERRKRNKEYAHSMKVCCKKCGLKDKVCLDFHHLSNKIETVAQLIRDATTIEKLQLEIDKCEVLCANCHKKEHSPEALSDGTDWKNFNAARIEKRRWFIEFINNSFCFDCQENDRRCLECHHLRDKLFQISYLMTSGHSLEFMKQEINKCVIVCTNCHRKRHGECVVMVA